MYHVQELAALVLESVESGRTLTESLADAQRRAPAMEARDRAALQDLAYGVQRHRAALALMLRVLVPSPLPVPRLESLLTVALYQLFHTRAAEYAVVNEAVKLASAEAKGRFKGLVNGVLRNALRRRAELADKVQADPVARFNHPDWWIARLRKDYPEDWASILEQSNVHPPMTLRVNRLHGTVADYLARLDAAGLAASSPGGDAVLLARPVNVRSLPGFAEGEVSVQDYGAQMAADWLDLADGQRVLDACAAPGGKTGHILERARVSLTALDADPARLSRVGDNLMRLGLQARVMAGDAGQPAGWWDGEPFDRILADVPCSASGVVRRHPDIRWLRRPEDFAKLARQQEKMTDALWSVLASGGKMLYATCSIFPEENADQLKAFLMRHSDAVCHRQQQLLPTGCHDGFYYALLEKC